MSQAPSMPLFVDAYLADTMHLSAEESGVYLHLLMAMWRRNGSIPDDDVDLARMTRMTIARWRKIKERLRPMLTFHDGEITQKRLRKEWNYVQETSGKQRAKALKKWADVKSKNNGLGTAAAYAEGNAETLPDECPHTQPHTHTQPQRKDSQKAFESFWNIYPRKVGKDAARKAFHSATKRASLEAIMRGAEHYAKARQGEDPKFTAHAATWLNAGRWADEECQHGPPRQDMFGGLRIPELPKLKRGAQ